MAEIIKLDLDTPGVSYMNARLAAGGVLSRSLLRTLGPVDNAFTPLPRNISPNKAVQFEHGGVTSHDGTMKWLIMEVGVRFPAKSEFCFLVEDPWAKHTDAATSARRHTLYTSDGSVIYAVAGEEFGETSLLEVLRSVTSFEYTGFVLSCRLPVIRHTATVLEEEAITELARHARLVLVSAFDREGLVISEARFPSQVAGKPVVPS
jgi:hypothetical protein